jgi:hypothetical protein
MGIRSTRKEPSEATGPVYRYGMLVFILVLFAWEMQLHLTLPPTYDGDPYKGYVVVLMLLFNHLAMAFNWRRRVVVALWVLAWSWLVFGLFYIFYLSHALYPSSPSLFSW